MKPSRLMHLLRHIIQKTDCPHCHASISPELIKVNTSSENMAVLSITCPSCKHHLQAHAFASFIDPKREQEEKQQSEITPEEMQLAHDILSRHSGDISSLFSKKS